MQRLLLADIGGTNTRVAQAQGRGLIAGSVRHYRNADHSGLDAVLAAYRRDTGAPVPDAAGLAMAGPVENGVGRLTNLDWALDTAALREATGAQSVVLLNDLQAQGHALGHLGAGTVQPVRRAPRAPGGTQLVIGIGTGFNAAPVFETPAGRFVPPSESGHVALPLRDATDLRLAGHLAVAGFASVEEALSGRGLGHIHDWVAGETATPRAASGAEVMARLAEGDAPARQAVGHFVRLLGAVAGDLALTLLPFGGICLIGGVARAMAPHLGPLGFEAAFRDKGRFSAYMDRFAVDVITDDDAALIGLAQALSADLERRPQG